VIEFVSGADSRTHWKLETAPAARSGGTEALA